MTRIIALMGAKGAGKSEVAQYLVDQHGYTRMRFADGVKGMLRTLGLTEAQTDGAEKESPIPLLGGKTYRDAATSLGTAWGRDMMDPDLWARALEQRMMAHTFAASRVRIVVDDVRFPNEHEMLQRWDAIFVRVRRQAAEPQLSPLRSFFLRHGFYRLSGVHVSEAHWRTLPFDIELQNQSTIEDLRAQIDGGLFKRANK